MRQLSDDGSAAFGRHFGGAPTVAAAAPAKIENLSNAPKIDPKPPSGLKVGSPSRFFMYFLVVPVFFVFFIRFGIDFRRFFNVFFDAFFDVSVCFFQTAEPSKSSPWTVF